MVHHDNPAHYGIRTKEYKLIYFYGLPLDSTGAIDFETPVGWELYDLVNDPEEMNNVYEDILYKDIIVELKRLLKKKKDEIGDEDAKYPEMMNLKQRLY